MALTLSNQFSLRSKFEQTQSLLQRCSNMEELKQVHAQMFKSGLIADAVSVTKLLEFCISPHSSNFTYARLIFDRIREPNAFMWNIMIRGYSHSNEPEQALYLYHQMLHHSVPHNAYTFPFVLKACSAMSALEETRQIHAGIIKLGFHSEIYATNSLLHVYATSGSIESAQILFDRIPQPDIVSWNSMIDGYVKRGEIQTAYEFFKDIPAKNVISWTTMIKGYIGVGSNKDALNLFHEMQMAGVNPDNVALISTLLACTRLGAVEQGRWIHSYIDKKGIEIDPFLGCSLIDMYVKCGDMEEGVEVFRKLENPGVPAWTAMISGFAIHGRGREALSWFTQMQKAGIKPNSITFTAVLMACSHTGLVNEGKSVFESIKKVYGLNPTIEHYGCLVDLLGRAALLEEAKELIETMPLKPNAVIWGALLNACHIHGNIELGKQIGKVLIEEDPDHGGRYIHLAKIHAASGEWDRAAKTRAQLKERRISKLPGCSAITLNGVIHEFLAGDESHPQIEEIYRMWDQIIGN